MADKIDYQKHRREQARQYFEAPFFAQGSPEVTIAAEHRVANALEYIAYQLHDIRESARKLSGRQNPSEPEGE